MKSVEKYICRALVSCLTSRFREDTVSTACFLSYLFAPFVPFLFSPGLYQIGADGTFDRVQGVFRPYTTFDIRHSTFDIRHSTFDIVFIKNFKFIKTSPFKNFCSPPNAVSLFENRDFLSRRPPMKFMNISPIKHFCTPPNAVSFVENRHFLSHRPPIKIRKSACFIFHVLRPLLLLRVKATRFLCSFQNQKSGKR